MNILKKIFGRTQPSGNLPGNFEDLERMSVEGFSQLSEDNRIVALMKSGTAQVNPDHFKIFQFALLSDPDRNVKFAALIRIYLFKGHADLLPMMNKLKEENNYGNLEPYFSMALSRVGLISLDEFNQTINNF